MQLDDLVLVSVDDHVVEPPDMFEASPAGQVARRRAAHGRRATTAPTCGCTTARRSSTSGSTPSPAVRPRSTAWSRRRSHEMRPGCYDIHERVRDMDANGVLGSMCFPSFPNLCGQLFAARHDKDAGTGDPEGLQRLAHRRVVRHVPRPLHPADAPADLGPERDGRPRCGACAAKGCHAVSFSENPSKLKLPSFHADHWDPFWQACFDEGTIVCLHIGSSSRLVITAQDAPIDVLITLQPVNIVQAAADLMWSPVLRKFPDLRIALSEGGIGWIPYFLERARLDLHPPPRMDGSGLRRPAAERGVPRAHRAVLHRRPVRASPSATASASTAICWEADYPHSDSTWPTSPETC